MSANVVNLRQRRKQQARADADSKAAANRAKFGERKAPKEQRQAETERLRRAHEAQKLTKPRE